MPSAPSRRPGASLVVCLVAAAALLVPAPSSLAASGRTLHVAEHGTDPARDVCTWGGVDRPWNNLADAFRCVEPGDTVLVHEGTYREVVSLGDSTSPGMADAPIVVTGAPGEDRPVIMGSLRVENADYWTIQDLEIVGDPALDYDDGGLHPLKLVGGRNWTVQRVEVHNAATYGLVRIEMRDGGEPARDWRLIDSCIHHTLPKHGSPDTPPYPDHNIYVYTGPGGSGLIEGNVVFSAPNGQNIKLGNADGAQTDDGTDNVVVRHNTLADAAQNITVVGPSNNNVIERNILAEVNYGEPWYPNVRGVHLRGTGNVARDNAWSGAAEVVHNRTGNTTTVGSLGNLRVAPGFDARGCGGFLPTDPAASPYGAEPRDLSGIDVPVERVAGDDRIATAIEVSREVHETADVVLMARADAYPDALASSALAGLKRAPVLLTGRDHVPSAVLDELRRLGTSRVILLGGEGALEAGVAADLQGAGVSVDRAAGGSRFETATRVADMVVTMRDNGVQPQVAGPSGEVILVEGANPDPGRGWPDAVSAGQLAAASGAPVLLTEAGRLPDATRSWLQATRPARVTVVGGAVAVSPEVVTEVDRIAGTVRRISGPDRYATSEAVADELTARRGGSTPPPRTFVASGRSFPDAMAVGPAAAQAGSVVVLYGTGTEAYERLRSYVAPVDDARLRVTVVGGPVAVPAELEDLWRMDVVAG